MLFLRFLFVKLSVWVMSKGVGDRCKTVGDDPDFTADIRHPTDGMNS